MKFLATLIGTHRKLATVLAVSVLFVVAGVTYVFVIGAGNGAGLYEVRAGSFVQEVTVSGKVKAADSVDMSFEQAGRIADIYVDIGDTVSAGSPLIAIASEGIVAQLAAARAEEARRKAERSSQLVTLEEVTSQQNTKVESAYRTLLSSSLQAIPQSSTYSVTPPTITGLYSGIAEGDYKFRIENLPGTQQHRLHVFDLESVEPRRIDEAMPTPLGTFGLYVSFPEPVSNYRNTTWYVSIPNKKSAAYAANFNAYQEAVRERTRAIEEAGAQLRRSEGTTIADAALQAARAEVARLEAELAKYTLRAPFAGVVTRIDVELGDTATQGLVAVTVISSDKLEIESFVPEIHISHIEIGDPAVVTLEAYGENTFFNARVVAIDPAETVRDGVSTYRVRLHFAEEDRRIKSGMTANIVITADEREQVISVPQEAVEQEKGVAFVTVRSGEVSERRQVMIGTASSLGTVEILSGLEEGEMVVLP